MVAHRNSVIFLIAASLAVPALAQSALEEQLADAIGTDTSKSGETKGKTPAAAKKGWNVPNDGSRKDAPCSMSYRDGTNVMGYIGPFKGWDKSYFFVSGPNLPFTNYPRTLRVALASDGDDNQTVKAFHYRTGKNEFALLFQLTDFAAALDVMDDAENIAVLLMEESDFKYKQSLFSGSWAGGHGAREKIRACLAAKK